MMGHQNIRSPAHGGADDPIGSARRNRCAVAVVVGFLAQTGEILLLELGQTDIK